jgi:hypothetical protein
MFGEAAVKVPLESGWAELKLLVIECAPDLPVFSE